MQRKNTERKEGGLQIVALSKTGQYKKCTRCRFIFSHFVFPSSSYLDIEITTTTLLFFWNFTDIH